MTQRITMEDLNHELALYVSLLRNLGIPAEGIALIGGSKTNGSPFKLVRITEGGGELEAPGVRDGFLGWTKPEAYRAMGFINNTLNGVLQHFDN